MEPVHGLVDGVSEGELSEHYSIIFVLLLCVEVVAPVLLCVFIVVLLF